MVNIRILCVIWKVFIIHHYTIRKSPFVCQTLDCFQNLREQHIDNDYYLNYLREDKEILTYHHFRERFKTKLGPSDKIVLNKTTGNAAPTAIG